MRSMCFIPAGFGERGVYMTPPLTGKRSVWIESQYLGICSAGVSGRRVTMCNMFLFLLSGLCATCFFWLVRGLVTHPPTELRGAKNHESIFCLFFFFLRRAHVVFLDSLVRPGDCGRRTARRWRLAAKSGPKVIF